MKKENIHDKLFKHTFSIRSEAKALVQEFLPTWLSKNLDYRYFKKSADTYVNENLSEYFTDMVYQCRWKQGSFLLISFLLEHKSYPDKRVAIQLLRYLTEAYDQQFKNEPKKEELRLIIPVIIYHGKAKWKPKKLSHHFRLPDKRLLGYLPIFDYELISLAEVGDDYLLNLSVGYYLRSTFLVFKHKNDKPFIEQFIQEIFIFVKHDLDKYMREAFNKALLLYIFQVFKLNKQEFQRIAKKIPKMTGILPGSLYEQLIEEGMEKGIKKGMEKGMEKGRYKKSIIGIRNMTLKKFEAATISEVLNESLSFVENIQLQLKQEKKIAALLKKKKNPQEIAKKLEVTVWLIESIRDLEKNTKK